MENNVIISIQGKQSFEAQDDDTIELVTEGCLEPDGDDGYTLSYQESELTGLEGTTTTFPDHLPDRAGPGHAPAGGGGQLPDGL